jgi:hypothetical protein
VCLEKAWADLHMTGRRRAHRTGSRTGFRPRNTLAAARSRQSRAGCILRHAACMRNGGSTDPNRDLAAPRAGDVGLAPQGTGGQRRDGAIGESVPARRDGGAR